MFPPMREDQTVSELSMTKAVRVGGRAIVFQLKPTGTIKMPGLKYNLFADHPFSRGLTEVVIDRISFFLSLSDDLDQFYRIAINDSNFAPVLQKLYGLHQVKFLTPFECACWAVLSQRNQLSAARKAKQALLERFGTSLEVNGHVYRAFPEPGQLAEASNERPRQNGEVSNREAINCRNGQSLRETDDCPETSCYRREIRTMEGILGLLSENSSGTVRKCQHGVAAHVILEILTLVRNTGLIG